MYLLLLLIHKLWSMVGQTALAVADLQVKVFNMAMVFGLALALILFSECTGLVSVPPVFGDGYHTEVRFD